MCIWICICSSCSCNCSCSCSCSCCCCCCCCCCCPCRCRCFLMITCLSLYIYMYRKEAWGSPERNWSGAGERFGNVISHCVLQCFVVFMEHDNTLNDYKTRTTYLGYAVLLTSLRFFNFFILCCSPPARWGLLDFITTSSSAHWAGKVPGWGAAVHTELGRSQVEVQRCTLSWAGPRLRSSGAQWAGKVPGWGPAVYTELGRWRRAWRRVGKATVDVEVEAEVVEEMLAKEEQEEQGEQEEQEEDS